MILVSMAARCLINELLACNKRSSACGSFTCRRRTTNAVWVHPEFQESKEFDVTLVRLEHELALGDRVRPIRLARPSDNVCASGTTGAVSGWGEMDCMHLHLVQCLRTPPLQLLHFLDFDPIFPTPNPIPTCIIPCCTRSRRTCGMVFE